MKKKTIWYVILRAIREKARPMLTEWEKKHKINLTETIEKINRRLKAIQKWLRFSDEVLDRWTVLAGKFFQWLMEEAKRRTITRSDIADAYPIIWSKFLLETSNQDDFMKNIIDKNDEEDVWKQLNEMEINEKKTKNEDKISRMRKTKQPNDADSEEDIDLNLRDLVDDEEEN